MSILQTQFFELLTTKCTARLTNLAGVLLATLAAIGLVLFAPNKTVAMQASPSIIGIVPSTPTTSGNNQNVSVFGSNFQAGLTVTVFFPNNSGQATLSGSQIQNVTSTSFTMVITLNGAGTWGIRVNNPNGAQSSVFNFNVQAVTPVINSISPSTPTASNSNQNVQVFGSNFQPGLTVTVFFPNNSGQATLSGSQIQNVTSTSFTMVITLNGAGMWGIRVSNPGGTQSSVFNFNVQVVIPIINSISPSSPTANNTNQNVQVFGNNFQAGLTVTVFFPNNGGQATLSGSQIQNINSTSFTMVITLNGAGTWGIRINNPDGGWSSVFNFNVQAVLPVINSISPASPTASNSNQDVQVFGGNFQSGLSVTVFFPNNGGQATLSGSQIQSVTSTSFTMLITLNGAGTWGIRANNPDGAQSSVFNFNVAQPVTPTISSISPSTPTASNSNQNVQVLGNNFQAGLTVTVFFPNNSGQATLSGSQIQSVTATSFTMIITLNGAGAWGIRVNNPNGAQSSTFNFNVQTVVPVINSISPTSPTASNSNRNAQVFGSDFQAGLTVTVFFPNNGGQATLSGSQIQSVTSTSFTMVVTLSGAGSWGIRVNNPDGGQSSVFNFTVAAPVTPTISSISPASPTASNANQNVQVNGNNFQAGLTVTVFFPNNSGQATLSGSQIQSVTSTSFTMVVTLNGAGMWGIRVNNPNGAQSSVFNFNVISVPAPTISSISPATPTASNSNQNVQVLGNNFQAGLTVTVFFPNNGGQATLSGSQIQSVTAASFTMVITLNGAGAWGIRVNNPDGAQSSIFNFNVQALTPTINSISPANPTASNSNQNVQVNGSNFQAGLTVTVFFPNNSGQATLSGSQIQNVTGTSFTMVITLNGTGTWGIRVSNPDGAQSSIFDFNVAPPVTPVINSISPAAPTASNSNQNVQVNGSNFQTGLTVTVFFPNNGGQATLSGSQIQNMTSTSFTMVITLNGAGTWGVRVNNPNGAQSSIFNFNVQSVVPVINSISPSTPTASNSNQNVQVNGSNFQAGLTVTIFFPNGGGQTTLSGSQIQNVTSTSFTMVITLNGAGTWGIRVNSPDGAQSSVFNFNVAPPMTPTINSISPSSPTADNSNQNVQVSGNNFQAELTVTVFFPNNGGQATLSGSQIQSVTSTSFTMVVTLNGAGTWGIRVNNPNGAQSSIFNFNVVSAPTPTISSISPSSPTSSNSNQNIQVFGNNFQAGLTVTVFFPNNGGQATLSGSQIQNVTATSFTMVITLNGAGMWGIRINNPDGGQSSIFNFNVQTVVPVINSISPANPTASNSNQNVQVLGSNFQTGLMVTVFFPNNSGQATLSGSQIQNVTSTSFTMVIALNGAGTWGIRVNNPNGAQSSIFNFTVVSAPTPIISSISPATPTASNSNQNVQVTGNNFQAGLTVTVFFPNNSGQATLSGSQIQNVTSTSFTMAITLNGAGTWGIQVNNPDGMQSSLFNFNVQTVVPVINSISPASPTASNGNQNVQVNGSNFQAGLTVTVFFPNNNGQATLSGSQIQNVTATTFTMVIALNGAGTWGIRVNNPNGAQSSVFNFTVVSAPTPTISSISPSSPTASNSNQNVQVFGNNFQAGLTVTVFFPNNGGQAALSGSQVQNVTATSFTMAITLNGAGIWGVRVNNPNGAQSSVFNFNVQLQPLAVILDRPAASCTSATLSWSQFTATNFVAYKIYRSPSAGVTTSATLLGTISTRSTTQYVDNSLPAATTFYYRVFVQVTNGDLIGSNEHSAKRSGGGSPTINSSPVTSATVGRQYIYNVQASDPESDALAFSLPTAPQGMTIDRGTGVITWTPNSGQIGSQRASVIVSDGCSQKPQDFTINVQNVTPENMVKIGGITLRAARITRVDGNTQVLSGDISFNDFLRFDGDLTLKNTGALVYTVSGEGAVSIAGSQVIFRSKFSFTLDGGPALTNFVRSQIRQELTLAGATIEIRNIFLLSDGVRVEGKLKFPLLLNVEGQINTIQITRSRGLEVGGQITVSDIPLPGGGRVEKVVVGYDPVKKVFTGSGRLKIEQRGSTLLAVDLDVEVKMGCFNRLRIEGESNLKGIPLGTTGVIIVGGNIEVKNICEGNFAITIGVDLTVGDPKLAEFIKLDNLQLTYQAPLTFVGEGTLQVSPVPYEKV